MVLQDRNVNLDGILLQPVLQPVLYPDRKANLYATLPSRLHKRQVLVSGNDLTGASIVTSHRFGRSGLLEIPGPERLQRRSQLSVESPGVSEGQSQIKTIDGQLAGGKACLATLSNRQRGLKLADNPQCHPDNNLDKNPEKKVQFSEPEGGVSKGEEEALKETRMTYRTPNKVLHKNDLQAVHVIILSEQL